MTRSQQEPAHGADDATMMRIGQAIMLHRGGDREEARNRLTALWAEAEDSGHLFHRCTIAHYLADTQDDPAEELRWDLRALSAAEALTGERARWPEHRRAVRSLYPALHLSLASDHARLGDEAAARRELGRARGSLAALADDPHGERLREEIERLARRLTEGPGPGGYARD
ncbi:hypothetical protein [Streptomyces cacaoi]|uniref:hypothetical protein n=1 Tax=Streptomyces cacaoi TaxID=1898 RepID=UPI001FD2C37D|nr:hypothetical protein [Streptomyces cacaoi]